MGWSTNATDSFKLFQSKVLDEYSRIVSEHSLKVIDARRSITDQQRQLRELVAASLEETTT
jgi:dTMP kinase